MLHLISAVCRTLLKHLILEGKDNVDLAKELITVLQSAPINLKLPKKEEAKEVDTYNNLMKRIKKARIKLPEILRIIEHQDLLLKCLDKSNSPERINSVSNNIYSLKFLKN